MKANIYLVFWKYVKALAFSIVLLISSLTVFADEDLRITISGPDEADPGEHLTYTVLFYNAGTTPAANVAIDVTLPSTAGQYTFDSSSPAGTVAGGHITWDKSQIGYLESLGAGAHTISFSIIAGTQSHTADGSAGYYMPQSGTNSLNLSASIQSDGTTTPVVTNPIQTTAVVESQSVELIDNLQGVIKSSTGTVIVYQLQVTNKGNVYDKYDLAAVNRQCDSSLQFDPLDFRFLDISGNPITSIGWLEPGESRIILFELTAPIGSNPGKWSCHDVTATSVLDDQVSAEKTITTEIVGSPNYPLVNLSVIDDQDPVQSGDTLTYTIFAYNSNDKNVANNFVVTNEFDSNVTFLSSSPSATTGSGSTATWSLGTLNYGLVGSKTITVKVLVNDLANFSCTGSIVNNAYATYNYGNNSTGRYPTSGTIKTTTTVENKPDLQLKKTANVSEADFAEAVTYTLTYENIGTCTATSVGIADIFDSSHATFTSASNGGTESAGEIIWTVPDIEPGESGSVSYTLTIKDALNFNPGTTPVINLASIDCSDQEDDDQNNFSSWIVYVYKLPNLKVEKSIVGDPSYLEPSVDYVYQISVENIGIIAQDNVVVTDTIPDGLTVTNSYSANDLGNGIYTWNVAQLGAGQTRVGLLAVQANQCSMVGSSVTNKAFAQGDYNDADETDNSDHLTTPIEDKVAPAVECQNITVQLDETGNVSITAADVTKSASDACGIASSVIDNDTFTCDNVGPNNVELTVTDVNGNVSTCTAVVTVEDKVAPAV
ncbi:putative repeat protein (TIGR01451 family), partial [Mangrovibacterium diazotrophicum]